MSMAGSNSDTEKNDDSTTTPSFMTQLQQFDFTDEAIDTALRKLLAKVILPKEAQQIDRAMEDFASHYHKCNPTLTDRPDPIYAVAFSILLLHTDAHNKNVKRKMNKDTFIKRTKVIEGGESVYSEILDVMYDNIVSSEFTYAQDQQDKPTSWFSKKSSQSNITLLHDLYPKLDQLMPAINTFGYKPTPRSAINIINIHKSIDKAPTIQLAGVRSRQQQLDGNETYLARVCKAGVIERKYDLTHGGKRAPARGWRPFGIILSGSQIMFFGDLSTFQSWIQQQEQQETTQVDISESPTSSAYPKQHIQHHHSYPSTPSSNVSTPTTVASLSTICSAQSYPVSSLSDLPIISSSSAVSTPLGSPRSSISTTTSILTSTSQSSSSSLSLRPVQIISLTDCICLYDDAYQKYPHVFRLITGDGQQFLIRGDNAEDADDWIQKINYMSTMKTTGVRLRPKSSAMDENDTTPNSTTTTTQRQHPHLPGAHYYYQQDDSSSSHHWAKREAKAKSKVISLSEKLMEHKRSLAKDEQLRNQLMVLTPMQKTTKDRMLLFAETIGKRLLDQRIILQRLECYREYIERELFYYQSMHVKSGSRHGGSSSDLLSGGGIYSGSGGPGSKNVKNGRGKMPMSRKLSAPLPFYSGLLQVRSTASSPKQHTESVADMKLLRPPPPLLGMSTASQTWNEDNTADTRMTHPPSSLLVSLSGGGYNNNDNENRTNDDDSTTEHTTTRNGTVTSDDSKETRLPYPYLDPIPTTGDLLHSGNNDCGRRIEGDDGMTNSSSIQPHFDNTSSPYYQQQQRQHHHPKVAEVARGSRQRSQSNPDSFVQIADSNDNNKHDDEDRHNPLSLQIPHIKKNRDRSVSDVTTDDEDFSIVVSHGEKDSLVNHVDRIVDAI